MQPRNYQRELDEIIAGLEKPASLLLHDCCAPCGSYCTEYLSQYFDITLFFYNPNITSKSEYDLRIAEVRRMLSEMPYKRSVALLEGNYEPERFFGIAKGLEACHEGGERCFRCYELRLRESASEAARLGCEYFTTTLSISPLKNAVRLNEIGEKLADEYGVKYLPSDFKKRGGYQRSIVLSRELGLYRQNYCGCVFSKREREAIESANAEKTML